MQVEQLSIDFLSQLRHGKDCKDVIERLAQTGMAELLTELPGDGERKVFWINIYNAFIINFLKSRSALLDSQQNRHILFRRMKFSIGGCRLSLNGVIHGLLRHSKIWWAKGYLSRLFANSFEKKFRIKNFDNRIHFAISYGSKSSPPVRIYNNKGIDCQLEQATRSYIDAEVNFFEEENIVTVPQIFNWYVADFDGKEGILSFLKKYDKIPWNSTPVIIYKPFSWEPEIGNYVNSK
jgi:hypothetical protein